ncbi:exodeoxyribonuclease [Acinetobacter phage Bestia]|nr:exodeoxyribonuclease [Acinetobacter phage Bestia]
MSCYDGIGEKLPIVTDLGVIEYELPVYSSKDVVAVFDLDFIVYSSACMADHTSIKVTSKKKGVVKYFKSRTEFNELLRGFNEKNPEGKLTKADFIIEDIVVPQPVSHALRSIKARIQGIMEVLGANKAEYYVGGEDNFRMRLPLPVPYKGNRKEMRKPTHLAESKKYAIEVIGAKSVYGREADDVVTQRAVQIRKQGAKAILIGEDKDAYGTFNIYTYNPKKDFEPFFIGESPSVWSTSFIGHIDTIEKVSIDKNTGKEKITYDYKGCGLAWKCYQIATGDDADGYHFLDIAKRLYCDKHGVSLMAAAKKIQLDRVGLVEKLNNAKEEKELWEILLEHSKKYYGEEPFEYTDHNGIKHTTDYIGVLNLYYHCVHMRLSVADDNTFYTILRKHGLYDGPFNPEVEYCYLFEK